MKNSDLSVFPKVKTQMAQSDLDHTKIYGNTFSEGGLTKREFLAAMAMQGMLANPELYKIASHKLNPDDIAEFYSIASVEQADELLKQLAQ